MVSDSAGPGARLGGFSNVDAQGGDDYVARLDAMKTLASFQAYKPDTYELLRLAPGAKAAEVGCGTGEDARELARLVGADGQVVGFDSSEAMLEQARTRHGDVANLEFRRADAAALEVPDGWFDAVRADRVLLHTPDPLRVLGEMRRAIRSGGRIVICEPDMPGCWLATSNNALSETVMREVANTCAHPYLARDLWATCREAGLEDLTLSVKTVTAFSPAAIDQILNVRAVALGLVSSGRIRQDEAQAWVEEILERGRTGRFVAGVSIMVVAGTKP